MNQERFQLLLDAYGAEPDRWPQVDREAGRAYLAEHPGALAALQAVRALDGALDAWTSNSVTKAFRDRVLASAPAPRASRSGWAWPKLWLSGAGLAAAGAAGAIVGATLIAPSLANAVPGDRGAMAGPLSDDISVLGSPFDMEPTG